MVSLKRKDKKVKTRNESTKSNFMTVLRSLFQMGQLDWAVHQKSAPATIQSLRYSAALGQELLARIEATKDRVSVFWVIHVDKPLTLSAE